MNESNRNESIRIENLTAPWHEANFNPFLCVLEYRYFIYFVCLFVFKHYCKHKTGLNYSRLRIYRETKALPLLFGA